MADAAALSAAFESHRAHLLRVAYSTLGSVADAEDVVQEAWLRLGRAPAAVRQLAARARRHVDEARPRHPATREDHRRVVEAFAVACAG